MYKRKVPASYAHSATSVTSSSATCTTVRHREFIRDINTTTTAFSNSTVLPLNAGLVETFPWLAKLAANFQEYSFSSLAFEFISTSADALGAASVNLGSVIMAVDYNPANPPFGAKNDMENSETSISGKPSGNLLMPVILGKRTGQPISNLFVRSQQQPAQTDIRFYDLGTLQIASQGTQTTGALFTLGELWVEYVVHLYKPVVSYSIILGNREMHYCNHWSTDTAAINGSTGAADARIVNPDGLPVTFTDNKVLLAPNFFTGPKQLLRVIMQFRTIDTVVTSANPNPFTITNLTNTAYPSYPDYIRRPYGNNGDDSVANTYTYNNSNSMSVTTAQFVRTFLYHYAVLDINEQSIIQLTNLSSGFSAGTPTVDIYLTLMQPGSY